ncbi:MAG: peptide deformylase [Candidatus Omnitrophica bacterium]|nr:peptide deformylase [Candidatus Omnitrophota bacterium]
MKIKTFGASSLRKKTRPVEKITEYHRDVLSKMARLMYESAGIGLAASQVGINQAMVVVDMGTGLYKLVNPRLIKKEGQQINVEGCLSVPDICIKVKRAKRVKVCAEDENGCPLTIDAEDLLACVLQHEIDHLNGKLIIDYASLLERARIGRRLTALKKKSKNEELPEPKTESCQLQL